ncbi:MAG: DUF4160 domain-containing protein [Candidatus Viridilinea halotolerans]|uniref:DUF4160 domain-containing protein n=1 Tax=Candidatus Viridilinea halotolerans TaxID=2491704 RepID=A0A426U5J3_9CHLR|nr:MAG: DUF4160 domain-containing protein [Candidatus Viridilinea halotolerans]
MPRISTFFGIVIWMYYNDHQPPHFHATYGDQEAIILIGSGDVYQGYLSRRAIRLVQEWEELHRAELVANWELARNVQPLQPIAPLA